VWVVQLPETMRQLIILLVFCLTSLISDGQPTDTETRKIKGLIWDNASNSTAIGATVMQYKTTNGTIIQPDGTFELNVPEGDTVLVHIPFCFASYYILYLPTDNYKKIILNKRLEKESTKTLRYWEKKRKT
jgi:hypothetical protein